MTAPRPFRPTRRSLLAAGAAVALTGCEVGEDPQEAPSPGTGGTTGPTTAAPDEDPDVALVDRVRTEIATAAALVGAARRAQPGLASRLAGYRQLHTRHLAALPGEEPDVRRPRLRGDEDAVVTAVGSSEGRLQQTLANAAVEAQSGPLAALLASMSAAVAQQLAVSG